MKKRGLGKVNISVVKDFFSINGKVNIDESEKGIKTDSKSSVKTEPFLGEEKILSAENIGDAYDRNREDKNDSLSDEKTGVSKEMLDKLAEVVTVEGFDAYEELGVIPDKDDPESTLTVSERIEIRLAAFCDDYVPTGSITMSEVEKMFGKTGVAAEIKNALDKVVNMQQVSEESSEYLLTNNLELTIDNIYRGQYSTFNSSDGKKAFSGLSDEDWQELKPQIENMLSSSGFEVSDNNLENAKWLVERKIPVTGENIWKLEKIHSINSNIGKISEGQWLNNIAHSVSYGMAPGRVSADFYSQISMNSFEAREIVENGTDDQVEALVLDGKEVTLLNMKKTEEINTSKAMEKRREIITVKQRQKIEENRRSLEELRLKMTIEASAVMIKNGINIDIMPLTKLVDELKNMEMKEASMVFSSLENVNNMEITVEQTEIYVEYGKIREGLYNTPAYILGQAAKTEINFTSEDIFYKGVELSAKLKAAGEAYEVLGTKPDRELGDSLAKAFDGIEDILKENDLQYSEENARAVRILAYNQMEITGENIFTIKEMDMEVSRLIENMTPKTTAYLIANGINPLKTDIRELNKRLDEINKEIGADEAEKYSEYLYKLERNKEIAKEDREAYIGIYRLLNMIQKGDRRVVGAVAKQGIDMNMKNLLTAARSFKHTGREVTIDDNFGMAEEINLSDTNIDKQIGVLESSVYVKRAWENISPENVRTSLEKKENTLTTEESLNNTTLNEIMENIAESSNNSEEEMMYNGLRCEEINEAAGLSEEALLNLMEDGSARTMENIIGITYYVMNGNKTFSGIRNLCDEDRVNEDIDSIKEMLEDGSSASDVAEKIMETTLDIKEALINKSKIDVRELRAVCKMSSYMTRAAKNNSFYVPVEINGEETTIKITLRATESDKGKINIKMYTGAGEITSEISVKHTRVNTFVSGSDVHSEMIKNIEDYFGKELNNCDFVLNSFTVSEEKYKSDNSVETVEDKVTTNKLFMVAKAFIKSVKNSV